MGRAQRGRGRPKAKVARRLGGGLRVGKPVTAVVRVGSAPPRTITIEAIRPRPIPRRQKPKTRLEKTGKRPRPTRVTVASPSGREGRTITVSSRSILARGRKKKTRIGARGKKVQKRTSTRKRPPPIIDRVPRQPRQPRPTFVSSLFQQQEEEERPRQPPRGRRRLRGERPPEDFGSDFDVLNFFG